MHGEDICALKGLVCFCVDVVKGTLQWASVRKSGHLFVDAANSELA